MQLVRGKESSFFLFSPSFLSFSLFFFLPLFVVPERGKEIE
jgi:hypothetical protein